jgi:hypothetical protein
MKRLFFPFVMAVTAVLLAGCPANPKTAPPPEPGSKSEETVLPAEKDAAPILPDPRTVVGTATETSLPEPTGTPTEITAVTSDPVGAAVSAVSSTESAVGMTGEVYSVQLLASTSEAGARVAKDAAMAKMSEPVDVVDEGGTWKVYAGRNADRAVIDRLRDELRGKGWPAAWTKKRTVSVSTPAPVTPTVETSSVPLGTMVYSVQVFAATSKAGADAVAAEVRMKTDLPVDVVDVGGTWKVFVGAGMTRTAIDAERDRLRGNGYSAAWTTRREK